MASFTDSKGREFTITMTVGLAEDLKEKYGLDFVAALYDIEKAYEVHGQLYKHLGRFCEIIHLACGSDMELSEFKKAMGGEEINNAFEALDQSFTDFYPPGPKRDRVARLKEKFKASLEENQSSLIPEIEEKIRREIRQELRDLAGLSTPGK